MDFDDVIPKTFFVVQQTVYPSQQRVRLAAGFSLALNQGRKRTLLLACVGTAWGTAEGHAG